MKKNLSLSGQAKSLKLGFWEHYKGGRYEVLGVAFHSETLEELVIYRAAYGEKFIWARPLKMFLDQVEVEGKKQPRFRFIGLIPKEV